MNTYLKIEVNPGKNKSYRRKEENSKFTGEIMLEIWTLNLLTLLYYNDVGV
jgi:hypothetical protein